MLDMGIIGGKRVWYTGKKSIRELLEDGELIAVPDGNSYCYKRTAAATEVEKRAALTIKEIEAIENGA